MATAAFRAVRVAHPDARIVVMGPAQHAGLLRDVPSFDEYLPLQGRSLVAVARHTRLLASRRFDWALILPDSPRTAIEAALARIPRRAGYARDPIRRLMITDRVPTPMLDGQRAAISMLERYRRITRALDIPDADDHLELVVHDGPRKHVAKAFGAEGIGPDTPVLLVTPGASYGASKLWPPAHFAAAADEISRRFGLLPVILPAPNAEEIAVAREVASLTKERSVRIQPDSLEVLKAIVERCTLLLTNDTGPRHVAVALDRPVVTLMGPTDPRHPQHLLERQSVLWEDVPCRPCGLKDCPIDHRCLTRIPPARVVRAAGELLGNVR